MKTTAIQDIARKVLCAALISGMAVMAPVSQVAAESYRSSYPSSETRDYRSDRQRAAENSQRETTDSSKGSWLGPILLGGGLLYLMLNGRGGSSGGSDSDGSSPGWLRQDDTQPSNQDPSNQDNGVGCFWGYDSMGTCVK